VVNEVSPELRGQFEPGVTDGHLVFQFQERTLSIFMAKTKVCQSLFHDFWPLEVPISLGENSLSMQNFGGTQRASRGRGYSFTMQRSLHVIAVLLLASASAAAERRVIRPEGYNRGLPFTPGILVDGTLYVAGFSGEDPQTGAVPRDFETEVKQAIEKIGVILKAADMQYGDVVSVQVYLTDMKLFERMNAVYRSYFPEPRPTRTIAGIAKLIGRSRIEITVTARK
jgi:2-iminobutanoate/2-iminopropanoate deaminase